MMHLKELKQHLQKPHIVQADCSVDTGPPLGVWQQDVGAVGCGVGPERTADIRSERDPRRVEAAGSTARWGLVRLT